MLKITLRSAKIFLMVLGSGLAVILVVYIMARAANEDPSFLTEDPLQTAQMPFYTGLLTNLGAMLWTAAATCNVLGTILAWEKRRMRWFFMVSAFITIWMGMDDLFMFHDQVFRDYIAIPEKLIFLTYAVLVCGYFLYFLKDILTTDHYPLLGIAMVLLATSMAMDAFLPSSHMETFYEDSAKFIGIANLLAYYSLTAIKTCKPQTRDY